MDVPTKVEVLGTQGLRNLVAWFARTPPAFEALRAYMPRPDSAVNRRSLGGLLAMLNVATHYTVHGCFKHLPAREVAMDLAAQLSNFRGRTSSAKHRQQAADRVVALVPAMACRALKALHGLCVPGEPLPEAPEELDPEALPQREHESMHALHTLTAAHVRQQLLVFPDTLGAITDGLHAFQEFYSPGKLFPDRPAPAASDSDSDTASDTASDSADSATGAFDFGKYTTAVRQLEQARAAANQSFCSELERRLLRTVETRQAALKDDVADAKALASAAEQLSEACEERLGAAEKRVSAVDKLAVAVERRLAAVERRVPEKRLVAVEQRLVAAAVAAPPPPPPPPRDAEAALDGLVSRRLAGASQALMAELRAEAAAMRRQLAVEVADEVRAALRRELAGEVRAALRQEMAAEVAAEVRAAARGESARLGVELKAAVGAAALQLVNTTDLRADVAQLRQEMAWVLPQLQHAFTSQWNAAMAQWQIQQVLPRPPSVQLPTVVAFDPPAAAAADN